VAAYAVDYESQGVFNALNFGHARGRRPKRDDIDQLLELTVRTLHLMRERPPWLFHFVAPVCDVTITSEPLESRTLLLPWRHCSGRARRICWQRGSYLTAPLTYLYRLRKSTPR